jgi:hypothetical protein
MIRIVMVGCHLPSRCALLGGAGVMPKKSWSVIWKRPGRRAMPTEGTTMETAAIRAHPRTAEAEATEACPGAEVRRDTDSSTVNETRK